MNLQTHKDWGEPCMGKHERSVCICTCTHTPHASHESNTGPSALETNKSKVKHSQTGCLLKACLLACVTISCQTSPREHAYNGACLIPVIFFPHHPVTFQDPNLNSFTLETGCQHMNYVWRANIHSSHISATCRERAAGIRKYKGGSGEMAQQFKALPALLPRAPVQF